jgi:hypothetical protein
MEMALCPHISRRGDTGEIFKQEFMVRETEVLNRTVDKVRNNGENERRSTVGK